MSHEQRIRDAIEWWKDIQTKFKKGSVFYNLAQRHIDKLTKELHEWTRN